MGKPWKQWQTLSSWAPNSLLMVTAHEIKRCLLLGRKAMTNLDSVLKSRDITLLKKVLCQGYGLSSGHIQLWELDHKESRGPKNWCLWTVMLEKTPESPLDSMGIKPVSFKGNQLWILIGRTDADAEAPVLWSSYVNNQLFGRVSDAGKDWGKKEKRAVLKKMAGWHHQCNAYELQGMMRGRTPGMLQSTGSQELDTTGQLNNVNNKQLINI